jgi:hypothetical protein
MGRVQIYATISVIWMAAAVIHLLAAVTIGPTSALHGIAAGASMGGSDWAMQQYEILAHWVPWIAVCGSGMFGIVYEYRYQKLTAVK